MTLLRDGAQVGQTVSDWFGDFKLDGLADQALSYTLVFTHPGYDTVRMTMQTDAAGTSVDVVPLTPASGQAAARQG